MYLQTKLRLLDIKVLVIDQSPDILLNADLILLAEGAIVETCARPIEAIRVCAAGEPQLAILDMMLPGRKSFYVLENIKRLPNPPFIIGLAGPRSQRYFDYGRALGVDAYLDKPLNAAALITTASALLNPDRATRNTLPDRRGGKVTPGNFDSDLWPII